MPGAASRYIRGNTEEMDAVMVHVERGGARAGNTRTLFLCENGALRCSGFAARASSLAQVARPGDAVVLIDWTDPASFDRHWR